jgi:hypothetical protein
VEVKDTLFLTPLSEQDLNALELQKHSSIVTQMTLNQTLSGHTNTVGNTLCLKIRSSRILR